ncbi:YafY family transcriptional regulator [Paenibacillus sp. N3/727]|uniref:helix-turn-helix transcriptional regulator n=1 Tax=Paenibacillus sp. N3/727 TaxID=2925845 RepID=UPI001F5365E4|nr:YafY family protein [Paenibacillus sp. N3/727]UNK19625.1 YafY family transcriptional regulator [Paenibacillus sp. N3/727]
MKIDRLLAITVLLLNRGRVSAKELSERFEVSSKTIYRDMDTLNQAGIPIVAHQGISGGFEIMEQFMIDRHWLSIEEMSSLVTAVKGINCALDDKETDALLQKVKSLLQKAQRGYAQDKREDRLIMDMNPWGQRNGIKETMQLLKQAVDERRRTAIEYISSGGRSQNRIIEPVSLILKSSIWYVHAYCTLRKDFRVFRLSRIQHAALTEEKFEPLEAPVIEQFQWDTSWSDTPEESLVLTFRSEARQRIADVFHPDEVTMLPGGAFRVEVVLKPDDWFYGMILSFGDLVKVESPDFVAEEVVRRAQQIMGRYLN